MDFGRLFSILFFCGFSILRFSLCFGFLMVFEFRKPAVWSTTGLFLSLVETKPTAGMIGFTAECYDLQRKLVAWICLRSLEKKRTWRKAKNKISPERQSQVPWRRQTRLEPSCLLQSTMTSFSLIFLRCGWRGPLKTRVGCGFGGLHSIASKQGTKDAIDMCIDIYIYIFVLFIYEFIMLYKYIYIYVISVT